MGITIGGLDFSDLTDGAVVAWFNAALKAQGLYRLRDDTAETWYAIMQAFHEVDTDAQTVRQLFYKCTTYGAVPKSEAGYNAIQRHVLNMRRRGIIPYAWVSDSARWQRKPNTYDSLEQFLRISRDAYRRALWRDQGAYVEVWCEKDALAGVIYPVTEMYDVPLMVSRGFSSETFVYEAAQAIMSINRPAFVYLLSDYDPSGVALARDIAKKLMNFGAAFTFERLALTTEQIARYNLPTRPAKKGDSRAKGWRGGCVELDALDAGVLQGLVRSAIEQHIDHYALQQTQLAERLERESLAHVIDNLGLA